MIITAATLALLPAVLQQGFDSQRLSAVRSRMEQFVQDQEVSGVVALVQRHGRTILDLAAGQANIEERLPMRRDTIFQVMSMTKPVTAAAVLICAERGLLNLDDRVERYLPKLADIAVRQADGTTKVRSRPPTIRHLLTHTSGLSSSDPGGLDDDTKAKMTLKDYAERYGSDPLNFEPGERISYSGPGISAAGRIVEIVTGVKFEEFVQKEILAPIGMNDTFFFAPASVRPRLASMYSNESGKLARYQPNPYREGSRYANPAGGLYSTADDMARFITMILCHGELGGRRVLSPRSAQAMSTLQTGSLLSDGNDAQGYALGFSVVRSASGTSHLKAIGSFGHSGAFGTDFWADPSTGTVVVFMTQSFNERVRKTFNTMLNAAFVGP